MNVQYKFLKTLQKLAGQNNESVSISKIEKKWKRFPGHDVIRSQVQAEYIQVNFKGYLPNSYTLLPSGREWIRAEKRNRRSTRASVAAAILSGIGVAVTLLLHFLP